MEKKKTVQSTKLSAELKFLMMSAAFAALCLILTRCGGDLFFEYKDTSVMLPPPKTIVIDAGHGGFDGGAVSQSGLVEKDVNLAVAKYLKSFLLLSGFDVVMTRESDVLLSSDTPTASKKRSDLLRRVEITESFDEPLFISIHQNKFAIEKYSGLQVYYSKNAPESKVLAECIQGHAKTILQPDNNRLAKPAGSAIFVLHRLKTPAVLVECGFLSNNSEAKLLETELYRRNLAFLIFEAVNAYLIGEY